MDDRERLRESAAARRARDREERMRLAAEAKTDLPFHAWGPRHYEIRRGEPWRSKRHLMDFARVVLDEAGPKTIILWKGSQIGFTQTLSAMHGWLVGEAGGRVVVAMPTDSEAGRYYRSYVRGVFHRVERLRLLVEAQPDVSTMRSRHKVFDDGAESMVQGGGTDDRYASFVCDWLFLDELDRYEQLAEGNSLSLSKRAVRNTGGKVVAGSTPTSAHGPSQIVAAWKDCGIAFVYCVKCPECGRLDDVKWERLLWDKTGTPEERGASAKLACGRCGSLWTHSKLRRAIEGGAWVEAFQEDEMPFPEPVPNGCRVGRAGELVGPKGGKRKWPEDAGFACTSLYSEWYRWESAVRDWLRASGDAAKQRVFVETILARPWMEEGDRVEASAVRKLAVNAPPDDHRLGIAAVDVQDGWLSVAAFLYGPGERAVLVERRELNGSVDVVGGAAWVELARWLATRPVWNGHGLRALAIDTGFHSDMTVRNAQRLKFSGARFLVKGVPGFHAPTYKRGTTTVRGVRRRLYLLGVDSLKMTAIQRYASGHFRVVDAIEDSVIGELEAEELVWAKTVGRKRRRWQQVGNRNELIDQSVYALAAARIVNMSDASIARLRKAAEKKKRRRKRYVAA